MTSTNINVGLFEKKNSSRVLKPPGGGHSDIFGIKENPAIVTPSKKNMGPKTTITDCLIHEEVDSKSKEKSETNGSENGENGHEVITPDENTEPTSVVAEEEEGLKKSPQPPRRVRVPPGGFSSGLW